MNKMRPQTRQIFGVLVLLSLVSIILYLFPFGGTLSEYILHLRLKKLVAYALVAVAASLSTISFQTITGNRFLTPSVLGLESLYVLAQSVYFFFFWRFTAGQTLDARLEFIVSICLMLGFVVLLQPWIQKLLRQGFGTILLICMAFGILFRSFSTFLQVLMDPNEYDKLQSRLFASFQRINEPILVWTVVLVVLLSLYLYYKNDMLDVLHLGKEEAVLLGVDVIGLQKQVLWGVVLLTAISTALVGPMSFFGFMMTNLIYPFLKEYRHKWLFTATSLLGFSFLILGQIAIERLLQFSLTISMLVELVGGAFFFYLLYKERMKQ